MKQDIHVAIIGGGITGLTAAYLLARMGFSVTILESAQGLGGLAGSFVVEGKPIEKYYHFICHEDHDLVSIIDELGISDKIQWQEAGTSFYINGRIYPFDTPWDLLRFNPIPFSQRIRFGLHVLMSQHRTNWQELDRITAKTWLIDHVGQKAYEMIWRPLLEIKFGSFYDQISAAWIWHRIHRVARSRQKMLGMNSYGYLEQGCATLVDALLRKLNEFPTFRIRTGCTVDKIQVENQRVQGLQLASQNEFVPADYVISTVALPHFLQILGDSGQFGSRLAGIEYLGIVCMLLQLDRPFTSSFWLNVNDSRIAFNGIVELTNLNTRPDLGGTHLVYIPFYMHRTDARWKLTDDEIFDEYTAALKLIRPDFSSKWVKNWWVSRDLYAQATCSVGFMDIMPDHTTPVHGLYITDSSQYYPEDRTVSASVRLGRQVSSLIIEKTG